MNDLEIWNSVISQYRVALSRDLDPDQFASKLRLTERVITQSEHEIFQSKITRDEKMVHLLETMLTKDRYWDPLLQYLEEAHQGHIAQNLRDAYKRIEDLQRELREGEVPFLTEALKSLQREIIRWIMDECQCIQRVWQNLLPNTELSRTFVDVVIQSASGSLTTVAIVEDGDFSYIWKTPGSRIVLEGDPGAGKSTYLCNLAMRWAKSFSEPGVGSELRERFDFVIYLPLGRIEGKSLFDFVKGMTEDASLSDISEIFSKKHRSRVLLLLDGFDEFDVQKFPEINEIIQLKKFFRVKTIISTRPSHTISIRMRHLTLVIKGFSEINAEVFIRKQSLEVSEMEELLQIRHILQEFSKNPLMLTALTVTVRSKNYPELKEKLKSASGFAVVIEMLLKNIFYRKMREGNELFDETDEKEFWHTIEQLGSLALQKITFGEKQKQIMEMYCPRSILSKVQAFQSNVFNLKLVKQAQNSGLIFEKRILNASGYILNDVEFIHLTVAEYISAYYISKYCESNDAFLAEFVEALFSENLVQTPLFFFLSKFSRRFTEAALLEMTKHESSAPRFSTITGTVEYNSSREFLELRRTEEDDIVECLKTIGHNVKSISLYGCRIGQRLAELFTLCEEIVLFACEIGTCSPDIHATLRIWKLDIYDTTFKDPPSFTALLANVDSLRLYYVYVNIDLEKKEFKLSNKLNLANLDFVCSLPFLHGLGFLRIIFTDSVIKDWARTGRVMEQLYRIIYHGCDFSNLNSPSLAKLSSLLKAREVVLKKCTVTKDLTSLIKDGSELNSSLEKFELVECKTVGISTDLLIHRLRELLGERLHVRDMLKHS